jgi:hypothetical protein
MERTQIFPSIMIALSLGAAFFYYLEGDIRKGTYWIAAAVITATVTF